MNPSEESEARRVSLCLAEIARTLESADECLDRVSRVLELVRYVVPYQRCAVLWAAGPAPKFVVTPDPGDVDRAAVRARLTHLLERMTLGAKTEAAPLEPTPNLTMPITGLDKVIGVLSVDGRRDVAFDTAHLRLLAVAAAQLGAYFTMIKMREDEARATKELAAAHEFQQLLVAIVSHDLRNPLSVITVGASSLLRKAPDANLARTIERTLRCAKKANRIIGDLLDVTHTRVHGALGIEPATVSLNALIEDVVEDARVSMGANVALELPKEPIEGVWDGGRIAQAVGNLLSNAIQHGVEGGNVRVAVSRTTEHVCIRVSNSGGAIAPELLPVIFDPFKQGEKKRRPGGGLGLGLYIVKQIVAAHGGEVTCESSPAQGTTFTLTLPFDGPRAIEHAMVLVVDDDVDTRATMTDALEAQGYRVTTAANGARALEQMRHGVKPVAVLVDVHMPVMDGATLVDLCKDDPTLRPIPMVVISSDQIAAAEVTRRGAAGFLHKPVKIDTLVATLERLKAVAA